MMSGAIRIFLIFGTTFLISICFIDGKSPTPTCCVSSCSSSQEFVDDNTATSEFNSFLDDMTQKTFIDSLNYRRECDTKKTIVVQIDHDDDFLWDLRFKMYNETKNADGKTLLLCACAPNKEYCEKENDGFRDCMKKVRTAMSSDLENNWKTAIDNELVKRCKNVDVIQI